MSQPTGTQSGTAGTDPNAQSGAGDGGQAGQPNDPTQQGDGAQSGDGTQTGQQSQAVSREDFERLQNQLRAADQKRTEAERKLTEAERAKLDETERTKLELNDAKKALEDIQRVNKELSLKLAFLSDNTYKWRDGEAALKLADLSGVEINEDGSVKGLKEALKKLADSKKYLLDEEEQQSQGQQQGKRPPAGAPVGGNNGGAGSDRTSLERKFQSLRGRV